MKTIFWIGLIVIILGIVSLLVPVPHTDHHGFHAGSVSIGVETTHDEKLPPIVGAIMILAGAGLMFSDKLRA